MCPERVVAAPSLVDVGTKSPTQARCTRLNGATEFVVEVCLGRHPTRLNPLLRPVMAIRGSIEPRLVQRARQRSHPRGKEVCDAGKLRGEHGQKRNPPNHDEIRCHAQEIPHCT